MKNTLEFMMSSIVLVIRTGLPDGLWSYFYILRDSVNKLDLFIGFDVLI